MIDPRLLWWKMNEYIHECNINEDVWKDIHDRINQHRDIPKLEKVLAMLHDHEYTVFIDTRAVCPPDKEEHMVNMRQAHFREIKALYAARAKVKRLVDTIGLVLNT